MSIKPEDESWLSGAPWLRLGNKDEAWIALRKERDELRAALNEALAQNERFNTRYRDSEAQNERLRAALERIAATGWPGSAEMRRIAIHALGNQARV